MAVRHKKKHFLRCRTMSLKVLFLAFLAPDASCLSRKPGFLSTGGWKASRAVKKDDKRDRSEPSSLHMVGRSVGKSGERSSPLFGGRKDRSYIALLTEPDACRNKARIAETVRAIKCAVETGGVDLVSIRAVPDEGDDKSDPAEFQANIVKLAEDIISIRREQGLNFILVVNDNVNAAIASNADGVHVKEHNVDKIPSVRDRLSRRRELTSGDNSRNIVGTSCHSVESGLNSWNKYCPDYMFVGTCFLTQSHPEKVSLDQLEGPALPGKVKRAILSEIAADSARNEYASSAHPPIIFAVGGINELNCAVPVVDHGCDGVAVIRSVLQAPDPGAVVCHMKDNMSQG